MNWFDKLKMSLILISIKGDLRKPQNYAMGRVPQGYKRWSVAQQYLYDIERILREMKAATSFVTSIPDEAFLNTHDISPENYIMYHQGYFLDLTHQLKDKLTHLLKAIVTPEKEYLRHKSNRLKFNTFLKDGYAKKVPGLLELLAQWDEASNNGEISRALKKRTNYHHYKNPLSAVKSYIQTNSLRFMLNPKNASYLTDFGKATLSKEAEENFQLWKKTASEKMDSILKAVNENIEEVSKSLLKYYKLRGIVQEAHQVNRYLKLSKSLEVKSDLYKKENLSGYKQAVLDLINKTLADIFQDSLVSVYVIGSFIRKDFMPGLSNINIVVVLMEDDSEAVVLTKLVLMEASKLLGIYIQGVFLSQEVFTNPENEKLRFICKSDGILWSGKDLLVDEKPKRISFDLAWILNKDFKEYHSRLKEKLENQTLTLSEVRLGIMLRQFSKRVYRLCFSMVIGNELIYTSNFKEMRALQNYFYPGNKPFNDMFYRFTLKPVRISREDFLLLLSKTDESISKMYETLEKYCDKNNLEKE